MLEPAEFAAIFVGGKLIQPTPTNKPTCVYFALSLCDATGGVANSFHPILLLLSSTVTIMSFSESQIVALFGTEWKPEALKGHEWTRGGTFLSLSLPSPPFFPLSC